VESHIHSLPLTGAPLGHGAADSPQRAHANPDVYKGIERSTPSAHRPPTSRNSPLLRLLSTRELPKRESEAKRAQAIRVKTNKGLNQSMLKDRWHELRPASLPVYNRTMAPPPLLPRSLPKLGWKRNSSHMIRHDPPQRAPFPFTHSPPGFPSPPNPGHPGPGSVEHLSTLPKVGPEGPIPPKDGDTPTPSPRTARAPTPDHYTASTTTTVELKILTINGQKAEANSPSMVDIITMLDYHAPDFLLLTKTWLPPHSGLLR
jgi:hypothetical protein